MKRSKLFPKIFSRLVADGESGPSESQITSILQRMEYILEGAGLGSWDWWLETNLVTFDERWCKMLGLDLKDTPQKLETWDSRLHPEDKEAAYRDVKLYLEGKTPYYENIHRLRHTNGNWIWILDRGRISEWDKDGKPIRFTGTHFDLTAYKEAEELSQSIQKMGSIGGWEFDLETNTAKWTSEVYKTYGLPPTTRPTLEIGLRPFRKENLRRICSHFRRCGEGVSYKDEFEFIDFNGNHKWIEATGHPVFDSYGKVKKLRGTFQDITARKNAELQNNSLRTELELSLKELSTITDKLNTILDTASMVTYECLANKNWTVNFISSHISEISGYPASDFIGDKVRSFASIIHPEDTKHVEEVVFQGINSGKPYELNYRILHRDQSIRWVWEKGLLSPVTGNLIGVILDVTKKLETERQLELERSKSIHNAKLASLGEMSAGVAHEINNPLAIIVANLSLMSRPNEDPEKIKERIASCLKATTRIDKIVNSLKKFSRSTSLKQFKFTLFQQLIEEILTIMESKTHRFNVKINLELEDNIFINCDEIELEQVLVNLVSNGVDAVKQLPEKWVTIRNFIEPQTGDAIIQVIDSGPGIPEAVEAKLFQPFFTTKEIGQGTGLGLSIAKGILEEHEAKISLNKTLPNTCFEIRFPAKHVSRSQKAA